jgi:hypothetical protein
VDHQVEDHVDVEAALGKRPEAVHLDEPGGLDERPGRFNGRIETLGMPHRQHGAARSRRRKEAIGGFE